MNIREIDPKSDEEVNLVAERMRQTLVDVLGEEKGGSMYSMEWLQARVRWHLDKKNTTAKVLVSENAVGHITGQAIARIEFGGDGVPYGYFSTIFVEPESRGCGIGTAFLNWIERWFVDLQLPKIVYNTAESNSRLIKLFCEHGYSVTDVQSEMVQLTKLLLR